MLVRIVRLTERLLPGKFSRIVLPVDAVKHELVVARHRKYAALLLPCAFLEEHFPEHILLLLVRVIVLYIVIMWLVEDRIAVMVAVRVLVTDSPRLAERLVRVERYGALLVLARD